ncbi:hypothetical protein JAAARDRAFT_646943 [Jaapia argillacea MUCL 33604]|uniref:Uncharacterized protein n=1 Tax=Jaapia argillacea MUCL 33604 TaxID=933084 RepID=A0A067Q8J8_9AGAM|nr:hypothetical protein JAAARDRAFT_646943 [Jaapia argillacea MUCL 33604]
MSEAAHEVYSKLLFPKKHGYPLWIPEPQNNLPDEYRRDGVTIGDVGIVTHDGGWDVLFNICLPAEHPLNARRPGCFQQIELDPGDTFDTPDFFPQSCVIGSKSIDARAFDMAGSLEMAPVGAPVGLGAGYQFSSSSNEGAMLVLPEGGHRQDHQNVAIFFDQALQHGVAWYKYAKETRGRRIPNDNALYLITGWDKAKSWALGAYSGTSAGGSFSAKFTATQVASGDISNTYFWEKSGPSTMRVGPRHRFAEGYHGRENQGAFIRGLKIAMKSRFLLRRYVEVSTIQAAREIVRRPISGSSSALKSSATSHSGSSSQPGSSTALYRRANAPSDDETGLEVTIDPIGSLSETYHPSDVINKCLLDSVCELLSSFRMSDCFSSSQMRS